VAMMNTNPKADLIIEADVERAMARVEDDIKAGKVWFLGLPSRSQIPDDVTSMVHRMATFMVTVHRKGAAARWN